MTDGADSMLRDFVRIDEETDDRQN
jgi:hypothetical protein